MTKAEQHKQIRDLFRQQEIAFVRTFTHEDILQMKLMQKKRNTRFLKRLKRVLDKFKNTPLDFTITRSCSKTKN